MNTVLESIQFTHNLSGEIWECGVHKGDTALKMKRILSEINDNRNLRMFDTFTGHPFMSQHDRHGPGTMSAPDLNQLKYYFEGYTNTHIHSGIMPFTFSGLEDKKISVANIDVDNYDSVKACLEFVYPRMESGGCIFIDDYACPMCPGAKKATNEFLKNYPEKIQGSYDPQVYIIKQ